MRDISDTRCDVTWTSWDNWKKDTINWDSWSDFRQPYWARGLWEDPLNHGDVGFRRSHKWVNEKTFSDTNWLDGKKWGIKWVWQWLKVNAKKYTGGTSWYIIILQVHISIYNLNAKCKHQCWRRKKTKKVTTTLIMGKPGYKSQWTFSMSLND